MKLSAFDVGILADLVLYRRVFQREPVVGLIASITNRFNALFLNGKFDRKPPGCRSVILLGLPIEKVKPT